MVLWRELKGLRSEEARSFAMFVLIYAGGFSIGRIGYVEDPWNDAYFLLAFTTVISMALLMLGIQWFKLQAYKINLEAGQGGSAKAAGFSDKRLDVEPVDQKAAPGTSRDIDDPDA